MATSDATIKLRELIGDATVGMLTSETPAGELHSRPLTLGEIDDQATLLFLVDGRADWVTGLRAGDEVNVSISDDDDKVWVSVSGTASVNEDRATIHRLWTPAAEIFFPDGVESPNIRVLAVQSRSAEYWDAPSSRVQRLAVMAGSLLGKTDAKRGESGSIDLK